MRLAVCPASRTSVQPSLGGGSESDSTFDFGSCNEDEKDLNEESDQEIMIFGQEANLVCGTSSSESDSEYASSYSSSSGDEIWEIAPEFEADHGTAELHRLV